MQELIQRLQTDLECSLEQANLILDPIQRYDRCLKLISEMTGELKTHIASHGFQNIEEEIYYFKKACPFFYSKHFYYCKVYGVELLKCSAGMECLRSKYDHDLKEIDLFFNQNSDLCKYFYGCLTYLDEQLFTTRSGRESVIDDLSPVIDPNLPLTTCKVSWIVANQDYRRYLEKELYRLDHPNESVQTKSGNQDVITLGVSKSYLVEEIIALHLAKVIYVNGEPATIAWLTEQAEVLVHTDLKDFKSLDYANRSRKKEPTPLLSGMIKMYIERATRLNK